ncbi:MAG TPA: hypothetical protein VGJ77_03495 [Gaiellaceae bacterium]
MYASVLDWIVTEYDPVTDDNEVEAFADAVYNANTATPRSGLRLTTAELREIAASGRLGSAAGWGQVLLCHILGGASRKDLTREARVL